MKQYTYKMQDNHIYKSENDPLELKKYVDLILQELDDSQKTKLKIKGRYYRKNISKKENEAIELREIPFVF